MANAGKDFEKDFISSVPDTVFHYRFKDGTAAWGGGSDNVRFQHNNICDFMLFDGRLLLLELKSHLKKSFPYDAVMGKYDRDKNKWSKEKQLNDLEKASHIKGIVAGYIFNFRDYDLTYFVHARHVHYFFYHSASKSFPFDWIQENGIEIKSELKKVHYKYYVDKFLEVI